MVCDPLAQLASATSRGIFERAEMRGNYLKEMVGRVGIEPPTPGPEGHDPSPPVTRARASDSRRDSGCDSLIHLYLFRVEQNRFFVNGDWVRSGDTVLQQAPIGLNLHYLITPYGPGQLGLQVTMGEIIGVLLCLAADLDTKYEKAFPASRPRSSCC